MDKNYSSPDDDILQYLASLGAQPQAPSAPPVQVAQAPVSDASDEEGDEDVSTPNVPSTNIKGPSTPITSKPDPAPVIQDNVSNKYQGLDLSSFSPQALQSAQNKANQNRLSTGVLGSIAGAIGTMTGTPTNSETWKNLEAQANQPLDQLKAQQQNITQGVQAQNLAQSSDPNSAFSKSMKASLKAVLGDKISDEDLQSMTGDQVETFLKSVSGPLASQAKLQALTAHYKSMEDIAGSKSDVAGTKAAAAASKTNNQVLGDVVKQLGQTRGNAALNQAKVTELAADKATEGINRMLSDPNMNNEQLYNAVIGEVAKMNMGGVPGHSEIQDQKFTSLVTGFNKTLGQLLNHPQDRAETTSLNQLKSYIGGIKNVAQSAIGRNLNSTLYNNAKRISPEDVEYLKNNPEYSAYFKAAADSQNNNSTANTPTNSGGAAPHGPSVIQNGVTYNWNPQTGKYE